MTVTDTREPSRNYPVPAPGNNGADDIARLITALTMIGADVAALIAALSGKASTAHGHDQAAITGLVDALAGKAPVGHTHGLDDLADVEATGQAAYQVLAWIAGRWAPWTVDLAHVAGNGVLRLDGPQTLTAAEKLQGRSNLAAAPLDSPEFTGAPKVPTVAITADSTAAANVTMLRTAVANLAGASPAALDTLVELAAALGNDANFSATMTDALAARLRVDAAQGLSTGQQAQGRANLGASNVLPVRGIHYALVSPDYARSSGASGDGVYVAGSDTVDMDSANTDTVVEVSVAVRLQLLADTSNTGAVEAAARIEWYDGTTWAALSGLTANAREAGVAVGSVHRQSVSLVGRLTQAQRYNAARWRLRIAIAAITTYTTVTVLDSAWSGIEHGSTLL